ncbi:PIN domain nuclease [Chitinophaga sp. Ak27]|uniref:type II toxin-antitoxin system VapC family toxin n=1 Tax=Chitinophaga sp. Ak27 TaxID=2726116 RepID=UPI00145DD03E|nr:PIN domain nuclease [Chitinophaga sp. Ak27]NLU93761.1 PIN domain nuclease [Chitinophaga sp. Ak27]
MNDPLIFDSSVWIDYAKKRESPQTKLLTYYLENELETPLVPTVIQEFLQGIREDAQHQKIKSAIRWYTRLELSPIAAAIGASDLFRSLRKKGLTIRKSHDCKIAFYAICFDLELVHNDSDFDLISTHSPLKIWKNNKG